MPVGKFKLSDTLGFLASRFSAITGGEVELSILLQDEQVEAGDVLQATIALRSPGKARAIDYLAITLEGQVQREDRWRDYTEGAEVAQDTIIAADHELLIPLLLHLPEDAVLSEDGATWTLRARAVIEQRLDPRAEAALEVVASSGGDKPGLTAFNLPEIDA